MPKEFKLSVKARSDMKVIFRYTYREFGEAKAHSYVSSFDDCFKLLIENPEMGRKYDGVKAGLQRHEHESHVIYYR